MHKKGAKLVPNSLIINLVTPVGFKPTTAGAEIQCAIQLRHEAFYDLVRK
jgi:hypothetical protein